MSIFLHGKGSRQRLYIHHLAVSRLYTQNEALLKPEREIIFTIDSISEVMHMDRSTLYRRWKNIPNPDSTNTL